VAEWARSLVYPTMTALLLTCLRELDHTRPPNDLSETLPTRQATAESHRESHPVTEEYLPLRPKRLVNASEDTLLMADAKTTGLDG